MTPKDKANELYSKYDDLLNKDFGNPIVFDNQLKQCASIAVDEMIIQNGELYLNSLGDKTIKFYIEKNAYLFELKQEIENL